MAGGGSSPTTSSTDNAQAQAQYNAAHQADRYVPTAATYQPANPAFQAAAPYTPPAPAPQSPFAQTPTYTNPTGYGQSTLAQYFANMPSYQQPGGSKGNTAFAADLASRTTAQANALTAQLKAAEDRRIAESAAAMKAYQIQKANAEWQAKLDAANKQISELRAAQASWDGSPSYSSSWDSPGGATGGLASLQGFDK